jgi:FMN phosphatase YigB (HAD superfamily)
MLKAVLLDLDNTMVLYDEPTFYRRYFSRICRAFADILRPDEFQARVLRATMALLHNNGEMSNRRFFLERFLLEQGHRGDEIWRRFMDFYHTEYDRIEVEPIVPSGLDHVLGALQERGLKLVVASNPIFPLLVQEKRMAWGGVDRYHFDLVTSIENMSFVKPRVEYYLQICEKIGEAPADCLMVGNDPVNDMVAAKAGIKTFLTTEAGKIDYTSLALTGDKPGRTDPIPPPDFTGPFAEVIGAVRRLAA